MRVRAAGTQQFGKLSLLLTRRQVLDPRNANERAQGALSQSNRIKAGKEKVLQWKCGGCRHEKRYDVGEQMVNARFPSRSSAPMGAACPVIHAQDINTSKRQRVCESGTGQFDEAGRGEGGITTHEEDGSVFPSAVKDEEPHGSAEELGTEAVSHSWSRGKMTAVSGSVVRDAGEELTDLGGEGGIHLQGLRVLQPSSLVRYVESWREREQVKVGRESDERSTLHRSLARDPAFSLRARRLQTSVMRSLELIAASFHSLAPTTSASSSSQTRASTAPSSTLCATTVDPATETKYAVLVVDPQTEQGDEGAFANLELYRLGSRPGQLVRLSTTPRFAFRSSTFETDTLRFSSNQPTRLTTLSTPPAPRSLVAPLVVSFKYLAEDDALVLVLANGEVEQIFLEGSNSAHRAAVRVRARFQLLGYRIRSHGMGTSVRKTC